MNKQIFLKLIEKKIDLHHYLILSFINEGEDISTLQEELKIKGWLGALCKKGYLFYINNVYSLTNKGESLIAAAENKESTSKKARKDVLQMVDSLTFKEFCIDLHKNIEDKIFILTSKKNYINPSGKLLNSSEKELSERLVGFFKRYGGKISYELIQKCILNYVDRAINKNIKYPIRIIYYIWNEKNGGVTSELLDDVNNIETEDITPKEKIDTTKLF